MIKINRPSISVISSSGISFASLQMIVENVLVTLRREATRRAMLREVEVWMMVAWFMCDFSVWW